MISAIGNRFFSPAAHYLQKGALVTKTARCFSSVANSRNKTDPDYRGIHFFVVTTNDAGRQIHPATEKEVHELVAQLLNKEEKGGITPEEQPKNPNRIL